MILNYILLECSGNGFGGLILFGLCCISLVILVIAAIILSLVKLHRKSKNKGGEPSQENSSIDTSLKVIKTISIILLAIIGMTFLNIL